MHYIRNNMVHTTVVSCLQLFTQFGYFYISVIFFKRFLRFFIILIQI